MNIYEMQFILISVIVHFMVIVKKITIDFGSVRSSLKNIEESWFKKWEYFVIWNDIYS